MGTAPAPAPAGAGAAVIARLVVEPDEVVDDIDAFYSLNHEYIHVAISRDMYHVTTFTLTKSTAGQFIFRSQIVPNITNHLLIL